MFSNRIRKSGRWFWAACAAFACVAIHGCGSGDLNSTARGTVAESSFEDSLDALSPNATKKITWEETGIKNLIAA